jgi:hypothetical protein
MMQRVAQRGAVADAVGQVLEKRGDGIVSCVDRQDDACEEPAAVGQLNPLVEHLRAPRELGAYARHASAFRGRWFIVDQPSRLAIEPDGDGLAGGLLQRGAR